MATLWEIPVEDTTRVHEVRVAAETTAQQAGLGPQRVAAAALVATELATNLLKHAGGGRILIDEVACGPAGQPRYGEPVVQIVAIDHGPGIPDVQRALQDGYSTAASLGAGLGTCRRIADTFQVHSTLGRGTVALARLTAKNIRPATGPAAAVVRVAGVRVALEGARVSGDAWSSTCGQDHVAVLLADGLGHGPAAAAAAHTATAALRDREARNPREVLDRLDADLRGTRGAAVAVAQIDLSTATVHFAGIGNIGARIGHDATWSHLISHPGIAGTHRPARVPVHHHPWRPGSVLVMHSDGLPSRWEPPHVPDLNRYDPAVIAAVIMRDASSAALPARDDTTITVVTHPDSVAT